jgi:4-hydroxyproline epimerase
MESVFFCIDGHAAGNSARRNVASYIAAQGVRREVPELGELTVDVACGGNFYAIIEPQEGYTIWIDPAHPFPTGFQVT